MARGRPRTPTRVLKLRGTYRADRHGPLEDEPQFDVLTELPPPPGFFDDVAKMEWARIGQTLIDQQLLTAVDLASFTQYCLCCARVVAAERAIAEHGLFITSPSGMMQANPAATIARQCGAEVRRFAQEFGLTPSARTRVRTPEKRPPPVASDPWAKVGAVDGNDPIGA